MSTTEMMTTTIESTTLDSTTIRVTTQPTTEPVTTVETPTVPGTTMDITTPGSTTAGSTTAEATQGLTELGIVTVDTTTEEVTAAGGTVGFEDYEVTDDVTTIDMTTTEAAAPAGRRRRAAEGEFTTSAMETTAETFDLWQLLLRDRRNPNDTMWANGYPHGNGSCVALILQGERWRFINMECSHKASYICEQNLGMFSLTVLEKLSMYHKLVMLSKITVVGILEEVNLTMFFFFLPNIEIVFIIPRFHVTSSWASTMFLLVISNQTFWLLLR